MKVRLSLALVVAVVGAVLIPGLAAAARSTEKEPCYCPTGPCRVWRHCWSTGHERIREQDETVLLMEHARRRLRDRRLPVRAGVWQAQHAGMHPSCSTSPSSPAANLEGLL
jgi:hypothetical protein